MSRRKAVFAVLAVLLVFSGCDDFILADQFKSASDRFAESQGAYNPNGSELYFMLQSTEMTSGETKNATILGGSPPYTLEMHEQYVYSSGETDLGVFVAESYSSGMTCGEIQLRVIDSAGTIATVNVFVRPRKIKNLSVTKIQSNRHTINWTYPQEALSFVEFFEIQRKSENGSFVTLALVDASILEFTDSDSLNENLNYRVRVHAADVQSVYVEVFFPK